MFTARSAQSTVQCYDEKKKHTVVHLYFSNGYFQVNFDFGPTMSDDEDFDGSGYGTVDEYFASQISPIEVQCQVHSHPTYTSVPTATQPPTKKVYI